MAMIFSMFMNMGFVSFFYPISVFGYALIEPHRPKHTFWKVVRNYTPILLFLKFVFNLSIFESMLASEEFVYWQ